MASGLPDRAVVRLDHGVRVLDEGRALIGGSPTRLLRLRPAAQARLRDREVRIEDAASRALAELLLDAGVASPVLTTLPPGPPASEVTFVIPAHGRAASLGRLLASLPTGHRTIVVDDASPQPDAVAAVADRHGAELVRLPVNVGPAAARNAGLRLVRSPFVAFADTDVVVGLDAVELLVRHFADSQLAMVAPRIRALRDGAGTNWIGRYEAARSSLDLSEHGGLVRPRAPISWVPSAFLVARTAALGQGFSEDLRLGEDVDLVWRLAGAGWRVRYEPAAEVAHDHRTEFGAWIKRKAEYGSSAADLAERHGRLVAPVVLAPWGVAFAGAILAQRRWSLPVAAGIAGIAAYRIARRLRGVDHPAAEAVRLTGKGALVVGSQSMALLNRHWWPLAVFGALVSPRIRHVVVAAAIVDAGIEYLRTRPRLDPVRFAFARRLDDAAYGLGVWWSAWRARSPKALLPDVRLRDAGEGRRDAAARADGAGPHSLG